MREETLNNAHHDFKVLVCYSTVMNALKKVDPDRKCFRMVGGVLVERTVKDVVPALQYNLEQVRGHLGIYSVMVYMCSASDMCFNNCS